MDTADTERRLQEVQDLRDESNAIGRGLDDIQSLVGMYQTLLLKVPVPYIAIDELSVVVEWNEAAESVFGWTASYAIGRSITDLVIPPDMAPAHRTGIAHHLLHGGGRILNKSVVMPARKADGTTVQVELTVREGRINGTHRYGALLLPVAPRAPV